MRTAEAGPRLRVAIGEDDVLLREGIARILTDAGLEVVVRSGDAEDLLHRTLAFRPDVVVTDVQMPPTGRTTAWWPRWSSAAAIPASAC